MTVCIDTDPAFLTGTSKYETMRLVLLNMNCIYGTFEIYRVLMITDF